MLWLWQWVNKIRKPQTFREKKKLWSIFQNCDFSEVTNLQLCPFFFSRCGTNCKLLATQLRFKVVRWVGKAHPHHHVLRFLRKVKVKKYHQPNNNKSVNLIQSLIFLRLVTWKSTRFSKKKKRRCKMWHSGRFMVDEQVYCHHRQQKFFVISSHKIPSKQMHSKLSKTCHFLYRCPKKKVKNMYCISKKKQQNEKRTNCGPSNLVGQLSSYGTLTRCPGVVGADFHLAAEVVGESCQVLQRGQHGGLQVRAFGASLVGLFAMMVGWLLVVCWLFLFFWMVVQMVQLRQPKATASMPCFPTGKTTIATLKN